VGSNRRRDRRGHSLSTLGRALGLGLVALSAAACGARVGPFATGHAGASPGSATSSSSAVPASSGASGAGASTKSPSTPAASGAAPAKAPASAPQAPSGPTPTTPGTYRYSQSGGFTALGSTQNVPAQGTIVVDAASPQGAGSWTQVWHSYIDPSQPPSDTTFSITPSGYAIVSEVIRMAGQTFTCTFSSPMLIVNWPPTVGHQFSGSANCGSFTVQASGSITGTQQTTVGGSPVTAYVVTTNVSTSGSVSSTSTETDWLDPVHELDVRQQSQEKGTYQGVAFQSDVTRTLNSTQPG